MKQNLLRVANLISIIKLNDSDIHELESKLKDKDIFVRDLENQITYIHIQSDREKMQAMSEFEKKIDRAKAVLTELIPLEFNESKSKFVTPKSNTRLIPQPKSKNSPIKQSEHIVQSNPINIVDPNSPNSTGTERSSENGLLDIELDQHKHDMSICIRPLHSIRKESPQKMIDLEELKETQQKVSVEKLDVFQNPMDNSNASFLKNEYLSKK